jgi:hypothetical protein
VAQRRVSNEADAKLAQQRPNFGFGAFGVHTEYSDCKAEIEWTACVRRIVSGPVSERPTDEKIVEDDPMTSPDLAQIMGGAMPAPA